jgi:hypothetical protein
MNGCSATTWFALNQIKTITMRTIERILDVVYLAVLTTAVVLTIVMLATGHAHASFTSVG